MSATSDATPSLSERIRRFFFAEEVPYGLAIVRIVMPMVLCIVVLQRWSSVRELFSTDGATTQLSLTYGWGKLLPEFPGSVAVALFTLLFVSLVTSMIGWHTRFSLWTSFTLFLYFNPLDSISTVTKYSVIATHVLLLLAVSNCGAIWSVDSWLAARRREEEGLPEPAEPPRFAAWPRRLMQIMIGVVYLGAAVTKMHTPAFFSGDQLLFWVNTNVNFANPLGEALNLVPWVLGLFAYITIVWEVLFVFIGWRGWGRAAMLGLGVAFHLGTLFMLGLYVFPMVCITIYFCFVNEDDLRRLQPWFASLRTRLFGEPEADAARQPWRNPLPEAIRFPSPVAHGLVAVVAVLVGVEIEHLMDPYGLRRPEGPHTLQEIPVEEARELLLSNTGRIDPKDKVFAFDLGSVMVGGILVDRRETFTQGQGLVAQVTFTPPHEDLWAQCDLFELGVDEETGDETRVVVDEMGMPVSREMMRTNFGYFLSEGIRPGRYELVLKLRSKEVASRRFTLLAKSGNAPVAN